MTIEAIYQSGVFKPLGEVRVKENQRVRLEILPDEAEVVRWLAEVRTTQARIRERVGVLPDSTPSISEDRQR